jgi:hypothetical protein
MVIIPLRSNTEGLSSQFGLLSCDAAEAFARDLFQAGGIEHGDVSVTVLDQTRLLQRAVSRFITVSDALGRLWNRCRHFDYRRNRAWILMMDHMPDPTKVARSALSSDILDLCISAEMMAALYPECPIVIVVKTVGLFIRPFRRLGCYPPYPWRH